MKIASMIGVEGSVFTAPVDWTGGMDLLKKYYGFYPMPITVTMPDGTIKRKVAYDVGLQDDIVFANGKRLSQWLDYEDSDETWNTYRGPSGPYK